MKNISCFAVLVLFAGLAAHAKTTTWTGGATGRFSEATNYDNGAPEPGDTVVFKKLVGLQSETFDFGSAGITIDNSAMLTNYVVFTGSGKLVKKGAGTMRVQAASTHTGGSKFENGIVQLYTTSVKGIGTGEIELARYSASAPELRFSAYAMVLTNAIRVTGSEEFTPLYCHNKATSKGPIVGECDFRISSGYGCFEFYSSFTLPGHTLRVSSTGGYTSSFNATLFRGPINGNVEVQSTSKTPVRMYAANPGIDNSLTVYACTNFLESTASWAGTNILVSGSEAVLALRSSRNLSADAVVKLASRGRLVADQITILKELWVDGVKQPAGVYTSTDLPASLGGGGLVVVGSGAAKTWVGGAKGTFDKAENWSPAIAPAAGDYLIFPAETTVTGGVYQIDAPGMTIVNSATLNFQLKVAGAGTLTKAGSGAFVLGTGKGDAVCGWTAYTGDICVRAGSLKITDTTNPKVLGTGKIRLEIAGDSPARLIFPNWGSGISNPVEIVGSRAPSPTVITQSNRVYLHETITADADITLEAWWGPMEFDKKISSPGHTVTFLNQREFAGGNSPVIYVGDEVDAHMALTGIGPTVVSSASVGIDNWLTVYNGSNVFTSAASWAGTNVVVAPVGTATAAILRLQGNGNLSRDAMVTVAANGRLILDSGVRAHVAGLKLGDTQLPIGVYRKADYPAFLDGNGSIVVGRPGMMILIR